MLFRSELAARIIVAFTLILRIGFDGIMLSNILSWTSGGIYCIIAFYYRLRKMEGRKPTSI